MPTDRAQWVGQLVERVEDAALLTGRGRYIDDLGIKPGTLDAAILRSPHAHADIVSIDTDAARALPGVAAVITGADLADITTGLVASVRAPIDARPIAVDRVRYVGEPVAVVVATDRYVAEDALDLIEASYRPRPAEVDPLAALAADAPVLHEAMGRNLVSRAETLDEVTAALHEHGAEARILAGGQSLLAMLNMRLAKPAILIDIMRIPALATISVEKDGIVISAGVRQATTLSRQSLADELPLLAAALPWVGHFQTRSRGTICGSAAHADPSAEIPLCLVALEGEIRLRAKRKKRRVAAETFFIGMMATDKADDEFIEAVASPKRRAGTGYAFAEVGRRHGDFAIVACAAVVDAKRMRLAVGGVADRPTARDFSHLSGAGLDDALNAFAWDLGAGDDLHATARYRRDLVRKLGRKVIEEAGSCRT